MRGEENCVGAHSEKEGATANFERGFGFHPLLAFVDHGAGAPQNPWQPCCAPDGPTPTPPPTT
jgi:hypothetical protein